MTDKLVTTSETAKGVGLSRWGIGQLSEIGSGDLVVREESERFGCLR